MHGHIFFVVINIFVVQIQGWPLFKIPSEEVVVAKRKNKPNQVVYALRKELYMSDM